MLFLKENVRLQLYFKKYTESKHLINAYYVPNTVQLQEVNVKRHTVLDSKEITFHWNIGYGNKHLLLYI